MFVKINNKVPWKFSVRVHGESHNYLKILFYKKIKYLIEKLNDTDVWPFADSYYWNRLGPRNTGHYELKSS